MERDRDAVLDSYATPAPEALDSLTSEERRNLYEMLKLKVWLARSGDLEVEMAGVPVDWLDRSSPAIGRTPRRAPRDGRTPALRFRALLTENGVRRLEIPKEGVAVETFP
jgi:hypothetical protein